MDNAYKSFPKINLLPREIRDQRRFELWYPWIAIAVVAAILVLLIVFSFLMLNNSSKASELAAIENETEVTASQADQLKKYQDMKELNDGRETISNEALQDRMDPFILGVALTKELIGNASVESIEFNDKDGMIIDAVIEDSGGNPDEKDWRGVAESIDRLNASSVFRNVWLNRGTMNDRYSTYEEYDSQRSASFQDNYLDVVNQFKLSADIKFTLSPSTDEALWTTRDEDGR